MWSTLPAFLGACLLIAMSPGPSTVLIIRNALRSRRAGMLTVLGNESGVFLWGIFAAFGLTAVLDASEIAYDVLRAVGAVVLLGFGVQTLRAARRTGRAGLADAIPDKAAAGGVRDYRAGLLLNLANPKASIFALAFLPQFVPQSVPEGAPHLTAMVALAALWAVFEVGYYALYVWGVDRMRALLSRPGARRRLEQVSGGVLILLGIRLAVES
ncbi:LysE family translocator [Streptomyces johnsoniae]|uniref:LysE family translocator n=1 Tax=Streptomyces johnsoniae TaxID=3075532 RepID=A0ABU2SDX4_9ACTN|nr:LysE family translocator [Streptomyces sp. DSM 41886]MDT0447188.1 LysE family translocator [Streptomyces sp. DSM 41886]